MSAQELAQQLLAIIAETRATALAATLSREPDDYGYDVAMHLGAGLNKLEALCKEQLTPQHPPRISYSQRVY